MDWQEITAEEFDSLPKTTKPPVPSEWDPIMARLEAGTPVRLPVADAADQRKKRLSVGRRAAMRGFEVEIRNEAGAMAVRRGADREKLRAGRLPKLVAEAAQGLVEKARKHLSDDGGPEDATPLEITDAAPAAATGDAHVPEITDVTLDDAPIPTPVTSVEDAASRPSARRRKSAGS